MVNRHVQEEMEKRYAHLVSRLTSLKTESEETWKTIETAEKTLMEMINTRDYDCAHYFVDEPRPDNKQPESMLIKMKADRQETEDFYLSVSLMILICYIYGFGERLFTRWRWEQRIVWVDMLLQSVATSKVAIGWQDSKTLHMDMNNIWSSVKNQTDTISFLINNELNCIWYS